jgi:hypothetical protein
MQPKIRSPSEIAEIITVGVADPTYDSRGYQSKKSKALKSFVTLYSTNEGE